MKTTIELPDELVRDIKVRAVKEDRSFKDLVTELLCLGLKGDTRRSSRRARFPLLQPSQVAQPGRELTPERVDELLMEDEVRRALQ